MRSMRRVPIESLGYDFIAPPFLPDGKDEYYLRNEQTHRPIDAYRPVNPQEIEILVANGNSAASWKDLHVTDQFSPDLIRNCEFHGLVRIGRLSRIALEFHELCVPVGITHSRLIACDIGDDVAIHHVRYLAHYIIGDNCILMNLDEMHVTNHAKFGNGIIKQGESPSVRVYMDLINEAGGRKVVPFDGMTAGDAYLWATFRDDPELLNRFEDMTQHAFDPRRGYYGTVGTGCVIKHSRIIKDVKLGDACYIKGANKLKNLTINSTEDEPTQIGEGVEMVNGIVGAGGHVFYGCKAVRFVMGSNSTLKYGARLIHSYLGDNSTVSCCEILNNLVFPAHEQHHNNSFLIASLVKGQSNIAAGATIGSNHTSRAPDGEIQAGRGFWPGLCVSVKHNSRFASFVLLAKGNYPAEMDIPLPFSLVNNDVARDRLTIMPAYWWRYNMYALARNTWKFQHRDRRKQVRQPIEFDYLAPDTAEEILDALHRLEHWTAIACLHDQHRSKDGLDSADLARMGRRLLTEPRQALPEYEILAEGLERSRRKVVILKAREGYQAYQEMLHYYAVRNLIDYLETHPESDLAAMNEALTGESCRHWVNLGGQLVRAQDLDALRDAIRDRKLATWDAVHECCEQLWEQYPLHKQRHAMATLLNLLGMQQLARADWLEALDRFARIQQYVNDQTRQTRLKDYQDPFRRMVYATDQEMEAVLGPIQDNAFIQETQNQSIATLDRLKEIRQRCR